MRKFEVVSEYKDKNINLPKRSTEYSAGYDIEAAEDITIPSIFQYEKEESFEGPLSLSSSAQINSGLGARATLVPTGLKAYCEPHEYISIVMRSSIAFKNKLIMPNAPATIDADYVDNPNNEGHIFIPMINLNPYPIKIKKGERIAQALFHPYLVVDNDENSSKEKERVGGFGSTGK